MSRSTRYYRDVEEIRQYIEQLGYETADFCFRDTNIRAGFEILNTTITVGFSFVLESGLVGYGSISMLNGPSALAADPSIAERSVQLYNRLYRRFGRPPKTPPAAPAA